jgi:anti-anti-sigma factor
MLRKLRFRIEKTLDSERRAWIYHLKGKFVGSQECYEFLEDARSRIDTHTPNVVLLMSEITFINSTAIGMIAALLTHSGSENGAVFLVGVSDSARRQLKATHVGDFLTMVDHLDDLPENLEK